MSMEDKTPEEVVVDFVKVRGDLVDKDGRASMLGVLYEKFMAPILELHRQVDDLGIGVTVCAQRCSEETTGRIHSFPCPTYSEASVYIPAGE